MMGYQWLCVALIFLVGCKPPFKEDPPPRPYTVIETRKQPVLKQFSIWVVVPVGSTEAQLREWHSEILEEYEGRGSRLFVAFHEGQRASDSSSMIAVDEGDKVLLWLKE